MSIILKSEKIIEAFIEQVAHELGNHILYRNLASLCKFKGLLKSSAWFTAQSQEEFTHYEKILSFLDESGHQALVDVEKLESQGVDGLKSMKDIYAAALKREEETTESINNICKLCLEEKDFIPLKFAQDLLYIQLQEEDEANDRFLATGLSSDDLIVDTYIGEMI